MELWTNKNKTKQNIICTVDEKDETVNIFEPKNTKQNKKNRATGLIEVGYSK